MSLNLWDALVCRTWYGEVQGTVPSMVRCVVGVGLASMLFGVAQTLFMVSAIHICIQWSEVLDIYDMYLFMLVRIKICLFICLCKLNRGLLGWHFGSRMHYVQGRHTQYVGGSMNQAALIQHSCFSLLLSLFFYIHNVSTSAFLQSILERLFRQVCHGPSGHSVYTLSGRLWLENVYPLCAFYLYIISQKTLGLLVVVQLKACVNC